MFGTPDMIPLFSSRKVMTNVDYLEEVLALAERTYGVNAHAPQDLRSSLSLGLAT